MEQVHRYIKRLLVFAICVFLFFVTSPYISFFLAIPFLLLAFSLLHSRITGEKAPHLFAFYRTENYFKKGGLRDLLRIFVTLFGFLYDTIIWTVWGIYLVFILFIDLIDFLKTIFYWIIHAIVWFLRQFLPFIVFSYKVLLHYLIRWPWWLYQIAYFNIRYAFNLNCYRIALKGTLLATFIIFLFYYLEIIVVHINGITYIGFIIALLPITWSFGEIASVRVHNLEDQIFNSIKLKFQNGIEAVRSILFYITLFVVLLLAQLGLNLLGWIPKSGIAIAGFVFNINTFISLLLLFISILIVLGVIVIPSFRLYNTFSELKISDSLRLIKSIFRKILQYLTISVPNAIFSVLIIIIPVILILIAGVLSNGLKNIITDVRIKNLKTEQAISQDPVQAYIYGKKSKLLENLKQFPQGLSQEIEHLENLTNEIAFEREDLNSVNEEHLRTVEKFKTHIDTLQKRIQSRAEINPSDLLLEEMKAQLSELQGGLKVFDTKKQEELAKIKTDIEFLEQYKKQIPFLFFFGGLWLVIFGSIALAFITSYLGNVYHQVFIFRNDETPSEWKNIVDDIRSTDQNQPLLGGTLFILAAFLLYGLIINPEFFAGIFSFLAILFGK